MRRCHGSTSPSLTNMHILSQCHQVVSIFWLLPRLLSWFLVSLSSLASGFRFLLFVFHFISFVFPFLWVHFRIVSSFLPISCCINSWHALRGNFMIRFFWFFCQLGHLALSLACRWLLTLGLEFCIFASDGDVLPWQRLNLGKPAFCGFSFVDLDRNPVPAITIPMAQTTDFWLSQTHGSDGSRTACFRDGVVC